MVARGNVANIKWSAKQMNETRVAQFRNMMANGRI